MRLILVYLTSVLLMTLLYTDCLVYGGKRKLEYVVFGLVWSVWNVWEYLDFKWQNSNFWGVNIVIRCHYHYIVIWFSVIKNRKYQNHYHSHLIQYQYFLIIHSMKPLLIFAGFYWWYCCYFIWGSWSLLHYDCCGDC